MEATTGRIGIEFGCRFSSLGSTEIARIESLLAFVGSAGQLKDSGRVDNQLRHALAHTAAGLGLMASAQYSACHAVPAPRSLRIANRQGHAQARRNSAADLIWWRHNLRRGGSARQETSRLTCAAQIAAELAWPAC